MTPKLPLKKQKQAVCGGCGQVERKYHKTRNRRLATLSGCPECGGKKWLKKTSPKTS